MSGNHPRGGDCVSLIGVVFPFIVFIVLTPADVVVDSIAISDGADVIVNDLASAASCTGGASSWQECVTGGWQVWVGVCGSV